MSYATMPEISFVTTTAAIAKDRYGRRGSAPAPRHERSLMSAGDEVPDVSVLSSLWDALGARGLGLQHLIFPSHLHHMLEPSPIGPFRR
jgi:hypothetical protein